MGFDIAKFFDNVPWDLLVKAVEAHTDAVRVKLYVERWLAAPLKLPDGSLKDRERGTPQGAPVSSVLANLFPHYAFDLWMDREFPTVWFERYADDAVLHCVSERQAVKVLSALENRMAEVGLRLHPDKTRIVYWKDGKRRGSFGATAFTFLGFTFRARCIQDRNGKRRRDAVHLLGCRSSCPRPGADATKPPPNAATT
ncbi:reverse transcriptase domain-containing protein [Streptomyces sp. NPDC000927]|uniref:reverse transcriptase domain-containing protein n=1 Tax=unclassified Streptomyces TaxID=2593676 RepID=UPI00332EFDB0